MKRQLSKSPQYSPAPLDLFQGYRDMRCEGRFVMYGKALEMERNVLQLYEEEFLDIKVKTDSIVNTVEEFIAELTQTAVYCSEVSNRGVHRCRYCGRITVDDPTKRNMIYEWEE